MFGLTLATASLENNKFTADYGGLHANIYSSSQTKTNVEQQLYPSFKPSV